MSPSLTALNNAWPRSLVASLLLLSPGTARAHDAFGDLGPFYASLLHPLADPLQAALIIGTAAFLAGCQLPFVRLAFPVLLVLSGLTATALTLDLVPSLSPVLVPFTVLAIGLAAMMPDRGLPSLVSFLLVAVCAGVMGIAPGSPEARNAAQWLSGTVIGIGLLSLLAWFALDTVARRLSPIVPKLAGSWVAAIGILVAAFSA